MLGEVGLCHIMIFIQLEFGTVRSWVVMLGHVHTIFSLENGSLASYIANRLGRREY